ncbi:hypothetical protein VCV18_006281 [Metarhizium anisopliae]
MWYYSVLADVGAAGWSDQAMEIGKSLLVLTLGGEEMLPWFSPEFVPNSTKELDSEFFLGTQTYMPK